MQQKKYTEIIRFNNTDVNTKKTIHRIEVILAVVVILIILYFLNLERARLFVQVRDLIIFIVCFAILYVGCLLFHEFIHFVPLWLFSKKRPKLGFLHVILRPNTHISKNEALISYLLPFFVITIIFFTVQFFVNPILRAALIVIGLIHFPMCSNDFLFSFRLFKCRGANIALAHEKPKKGTETIFYSVE